jgi:mRNA interferase MazF
MVISQGDVFWWNWEGRLDRVPAFVTLTWLFKTTSSIGAALTLSLSAPSTRISAAQIPGNLLLDSGEAGLPKRNVIVVSQVFTVDKSQLSEHIGTLSRKRIRQILDGLKLLTEPGEVE